MAHLLSELFKDGLIIERISPIQKVAYVSSFD